MDVRSAGSVYLVGASADATDSGPDIEWTVQVQRHRTLADKLLGKNKMAADDPLSTQIRADATFKDIAVEKSA